MLGDKKLNININSLNLFYKYCLLSHKIIINQTYSDSPQLNAIPYLYVSKTL
jgi:hypothetical protein